MRLQVGSVVIYTKKKTKHKICLKSCLHLNSEHYIFITVNSLDFKRTNVFQGYKIECFWIWVNWLFWILTCVLLQTVGLLTYICVLPTCSLFNNRKLIQNNRSYEFNRPDLCVGFVEANFSAFHRKQTDSVLGHGYFLWVQQINLFQKRACAHTHIHTLIHTHRKSKP